MHYGQTCSPLIVDDKIIIAGSHPPAPSLLAFDKLTGEPIWHCDGDSASYSSPSLVTLGGVRQILLVHQTSIAGHDVADGHLLWKHNWPGIMPKNSQPIAIAPDEVYASTGYGIGSVLLHVQSAGSPTLVSLGFHADEDQQCRAT